MDKPGTYICQMMLYRSHRAANLQMQLIRGPLPNPNELGRSDRIATQKALPRSINHGICGARCTRNEETETVRDEYVKRQRYEEMVDSNCVNKAHIQHADTDDQQVDIGTAEAAEVSHRTTAREQAENGTMIRKNVRIQGRRETSLGRADPIGEYSV